MSTTRIVFTDDALDDLRRLGPGDVPKVLKKILLLEVDPKAGYPLGGELAGFRKLVVGRNTWRVVYRLLDGGLVEVCEIWAVGLRSDADVYTEATARARTAAARNPELHLLADVVQRLGRLAGISVEPAEPQREPVPDWLAERLTCTAGFPRHEVSAMDAEQALEAWTAFVSRRRQEP